MPVPTDGRMTLDGGFTIQCLEWKKSPVYSLVKDRTVVAYFDSMKGALSLYNRIRRTEIQPDTKMLEAFQRAESYAREGE